MKSYEQLRTEYDDALFALLMDDAMQTEGEALLAENERLKSESDFVISSETHERTLTAICEAYWIKSRRNRGARFRRMIGKGVAAVFAAAVLVGIGCAVNPTVKAKTLKLMMTITNQATILFVDDGSEIPPWLVAPDQSDSDHDRTEYEITFIPDGFYQHSELQTEHFNMQEFKNDDEALISVQITHSHGNMISSMDTENADVVEEITINGNNGLLVEKGQRVHIETYDVNEMDYFDVVCLNVDRETVIKIAEGIKPFR